MATQAVERIDELLSLETAPANSLTPEEREALEELLEGAGDSGDPGELAQLAARAAQALIRYGENLRAIYATGLWQEIRGEAEEAGRSFQRLARELGRKGDWPAARELALRSLPLRADYRVVRLLLEIHRHLPDHESLEADLALAQAHCPDSPDLLWRDCQEADAGGREDLAEELAVRALARFVAVKEPDRAEEPLLRLLSTADRRAYRDLLKVLPRMANAGLRELLDTTLALTAEAFARHGLKGDLARVLERLILKDPKFEYLRGTYLTVLQESLGGSEETAAFLRECGVGELQIPFERALQRFREMYNYRPGAFVEHHNFGVGRIAAHDGAFLSVDFADRPGHRMAMEIAVRSLRPLPEGCLRAALVAEADALAQEIEKDPVSVLLRALKDLGGQAGARELRETLAGRIIPDAEWSSWWKRARDAAHRDPRLDTSHAYRQIYRLPGEVEEEDLELPPLPAKSGAQGATLFLEKLLRQHPELDERARHAYAQELAARAVAGPSSESVTAVPVLMRWLPERAEEWEAIARRAFEREPGVAGGVTAEQQEELLALGLAGPMWQAAASTALASRFPPIREKALAALRDRLPGERFMAELRQLLLDRNGRSGTKLALARLALQGRLEGLELSPWELLIGVLTVVAADPPQKTRHVALELLDPQERLAGLLRAVPSDHTFEERLRLVLRDLAASESGLEPVALILAESGHLEVIEHLRRELQDEATNPVAIHFDPKVTLMTRTTFESNTIKIRELQHLLSNVIPQEIGAARSLGDLAENAEYHAARERQGITDATLRSLRSQMEYARVIEDTRFPENTAVVGTEVLLRNLADNSEQTVWLLGQGDSVQDPHVINYRAPLGQALVGKKIGEVADYEAEGVRHRLQVVSLKRRLP